MSSEPRELLRLLREIMILRLLDHPNIIKIIDVFSPIYSPNFQLQQLYIVFEFAGENLHQFLASSHTHVLHFTESDAASIMRQMLAATGYLHRCRVIHRDLKPENVLVQRGHDGTLVVKLGDFGLCREFFEFESLGRDAVSIFQRSLPRTVSGSARLPSDGASLAEDEMSIEQQNVMQIAANSVGVVIDPGDNEIFDGDDMFAHPLVRQQSAFTVTPQYRAPEIYMSDGYYDQAIDVWSLGCILYDMLFIVQQNRRHSELIASGKLPKPQTLVHRELVKFFFINILSMLSDHALQVMRQKKLFAGVDQPTLENPSIEEDMYTRMFEVCGNPARDTVDRMCRDRRWIPIMDAHLSRPNRGVGFKQRLPECSDLAIDLLKEMLTFDNQNRISAAQAFQHAFVQPGPKATIDDVVGHRSAVQTAKAISSMNLDLAPESSREQQISTIMRAIERERAHYVH